jgi:cytochrome c oxidase subunit I+III
LSALLLVASAICYAVSLRTLGPAGRETLWTPLLVIAGALCLGTAVAIEVYGHLEARLDPTQTSYGALVYMESVLTGQLALAVLIMAGFVTARHFAGRLNREWRASLEHTALLAFYSVGQGLLGLLIIHGFPRLVA